MLNHIIEIEQREREKKTKKAKPEREKITPETGIRKTKNRKAHSHVDEETMYFLFLYSCVIFMVFSMASGENSEPVIGILAQVSKKVIICHSINTINIVYSNRNTGVILVISLKHHIHI